MDDVYGVRDDSCKSGSFGQIFSDKFDSGAFYHLEAPGLKYKSMGIMTMTWDIPSIVEGLKNLFVLEDDFVYGGPRSDIDVGELDGEPPAPPAGSFAALFNPPKRRK